MDRMNLSDNSDSIYRRNNEIGDSEIKNELPKGKIHIPNKSTHEQFQPNTRIEDRTSISKIKTEKQSNSTVYFDYIEDQYKKTPQLLQELERKQNILIIKKKQLSEELRIKNQSELKKIDEEKEKKDKELNKLISEFNILIQSANPESTTLHSTDECCEFMVACSSNAMTCLNELKEKIRSISSKNLDVANDYIELFTRELKEVSNTQDHYYKSFLEHMLVLKQELQQTSSNDKAKGHISEDDKQEINNLLKKTIDKWKIAYGCNMLLNPILKVSEEVASLEEKKSEYLVTDEITKLHSQEVQCACEIEKYKKTLKNLDFLINNFPKMLKKNDSEFLIVKLKEINFTGILKDKLSTLIHSINNICDSKEHSDLHMDKIKTITKCFSWFLEDKVINKNDRHSSLEEFKLLLLEYIEDNTIDKSITDNETLNLFNSILSSAIEAEITFKQLKETIDKDWESSFGNADTCWEYLLDGRIHDFGRYAFDNEKNYLSGMYNSLHYCLKCLTDGTNIASKDFLTRLVEKTTAIGYKEMFSGTGCFDIQGGVALTKNGFLHLLDVGFWHPDFLADYFRSMESFDSSNLPKPMDIHKRLFKIEIKGFDSETKFLCVTVTSDTNDITHEAFLDQCLVDFHKEMNSFDENTTDKEKVLAIIKLCKQLELKHMLSDGNCRTMCVLFFITLLIKYGFNPVKQFDPNYFDGHTEEELYTILEPQIRRKSTEPI